MTVLFVCSFLSGALHLLFSAYCLLLSDFPWGGTI